MKTLLAAATCVLGLTLPGCTRLGKEISAAQANLVNRNGTQIGTARFVAADGGVRLELTASGLEPGIHAMHIHEGSSCQEPAFESARGHFNPENKAHGYESSGGSHAGDLRNIEVSYSGNIDVQRTLTDLKLGTGEFSIIGRAIVIHAGADDYESQPSGNAGARVACGEIVAVPLTNYESPTG
jgi:Cu-Zn family superoxide dismutase